MITHTLTANMERLLELAKKVVMSDEEREEQRRSFAFGNSKIENDNITRDLINELADKM